MFIDSKGRKWFKGNLHTHTTVSDGILSPEEVCKLYKSNGYDFISLTDHWKYGEQTVFEDMLVLSGCEYNLNNGVKKGFHHILGVGTEKFPENISEASSPEEVIEAIHACGGLVIYGHPAWSLNTFDQLLQVKDADAVEIFNSVSDLPRNCRPDSSLLLDIMAANGVFWNIIATDDAHFYEKADTCRSFVYVQAEECTREALLDAIKKGNCYASQGPILDATFADGKLTVDCSSVEQIVYFGDSPWSNHRSDVGENLTHGEYVPHNRNEAYRDRFVRVEVQDNSGRKAWSQYFKVEV